MPLIHHVTLIDLECPWIDLEFSWMFMNERKCPWLPVNALDCLWMPANDSKCPWLFGNTFKSICRIGQLFKCVGKPSQFFWLAVQNSVAFFRGGWGWGEGGVKAILWTDCCCQKYACNYVHTFFFLTLCFKGSNKKFEYSPRTKSKISPNLSRH